MSHHHHHHDEPHSKERNHHHPESGRSRLPIHPAWFYTLGFVMVLLVVLVWTLI